MAAMPDETLSFYGGMTDAQLRDWVEANPERVNDEDDYGSTPLLVAVDRAGSLSLVLWLLDEKGADINATGYDGDTALHLAASVDIAIAMLDRGADPTALDVMRMSPLMDWIYEWFRNPQSRDRRPLEKITRLLQEPRIRATVNLQNAYGDTALQHACSRFGSISSPFIVHAHLHAGANPSLKGYHGQYCSRTHLKHLRREHSKHRDTIALLEQVPDAEKSWLLVTARRLIGAPAHRRCRRWHRIYTLLPAKPCG